ncbi:pro-sigmaK processing inhibitor BofA family protein [Rummeliibacillus suwonensis]|uniref:pro-sigmaK processing inhibitor BofA family protein n=1 Tax=Rummeliibacillus suwonensis TaxID=1306154 RepID=UPI0011B41B33|nr:pro-sigmaK processing inhibitor BofA family protein [Rummeliibacillus suwonensis]MBO2537410.1 pro-sigmaK processing inhibitor BofA family protein [Rummeliibacillus suwonensis]
MAKLIISLIGVLFICYWIIRRPKGIRKVLELFSNVAFRITLSFCVLYALSYGAGYLGIWVPLNFASILIVALLGIPGVLLIVCLTGFNYFFP